jgi:hypothetical protein
MHGTVSARMVEDRLGLRVSTSTTLESRQETDTPVIFVREERGRNFVTGI